MVGRERKYLDKGKGIELGEWGKDGSTREERKERGIGKASVGVSWKRTKGKSKRKVNKR